MQHAINIHIYRENEKSEWELTITSNKDQDDFVTGTQDVLDTIRALVDHLNK